MNELKLDFTHKAYPYLEEPHDSDIRWGRICLYITSSDCELLKIILDTEWDLRALIEWFTENEEKILLLDYPIKSSIKESIAKRIYKFYNDDDKFQEHLIDKVFEYRKEHGLRFALRGTYINDIYLGKNGSLFEISFYDNQESWRYNVDLKKFFDELKGSNNYAELTR